MSATTGATEGWAWPANARKAHYYVNHRSLCCKWGMLGTHFEQGNDDSPSNCAECRRKLAERNRRVREA